VPISDIDFDILLGKVSTMMKHKYLDPYENKSSIAKGIIYGFLLRPIVSLPVSTGHQKERICVHFLVDTGAPITYLSA
jgi:hypothetical protein